MKNFSMTRFVNFGKWDLAINKTFYSKAFFAIFGIMAAPVLVRCFMFLTYAGQGEYAWEIFTANMGETTIRFFGLILPFLFGFVFHNLSTKQGRISELTLPASNCERFVWHACLILFGSLAIAVFSFFVLDLLQYIFVGSVFGFSHAHEFIASMLSMFENSGGFRGNEYIRHLARVAFLSTFVLGNALKYRQNILLTIAFHIVFFLVGMFCAALLVGLLLEKQMYGYSTWIDEHEAMMETIAVAFFVLETTGCWVWSYVLYRKAQVTTKRNK